MERRDVLSALIASSIPAIAGCTDGLQSGSFPGGQSDDSTNAEQVVQSFIEASNNGDLTAIQEAVHPDSEVYVTNESEVSSTNVTVESINEQSVQQFVNAYSGMNTTEEFNQTLNNQVFTHPDLQYQDYAYDDYTYVFVSASREESDDFGALFALVESDGELAIWKIIFMQQLSSGSGPAGENQALTGGSGGDQSTPSGSVVINDQETDGDSVTVASVQTEGEAIIQVSDSDGKFLGKPEIRFEPNETREDITVELDSPLSDTQMISVHLYWCKESGPDTCNGPSIAQDNAMITVSDAGEETTTTETTETTSTPSGSVVINDQETDGDSVTVASVQTEGEAIIQVSDSDGNFLARPGIRFEPNETREDITVELDSSLSDTQTITIRLFWCKESGPDTCNGPSIAQDSATITVSE